MVVFVFGCVILMPSSLIFPKKNKRIAFIGRDDGQFIDNVKYLYLYAQNKIINGLDVYFITENKLIYNELFKNKLNVVYHPTFKSILKMLSTKITVIDAPSWVNKFKYFLLFRSKKIQLWHGIPLKKIQLECKNMGFKKTSKLKLRLNSIYDKIALLSPKYDLLISTSKYFTKNAFKKAFNFEKIIEAEYPRNDFLINNSVTKDRNNKYQLIWTDIEIIKKVERYKKEGKKIILYAPTFRETGNDLFEMKNNIFDNWSKLGSENNIVFVIKSHPLINLDQKMYNKKNMLYYTSNKDIYPLLNLVDMLITDYSSIYFDFLLLDNPIIFFPYDYNKYITSDKELRFNYNSFTPGPKCYSEKQLEDEIIKILIQKIDEYVVRRKKVKKYCFKSEVGNGAEEVWKQINTLYIN